MLLLHVSKGADTCNSYHMEAAVVNGDSVVADCPWISQPV